MSEVKAAWTNEDNFSIETTTSDYIKRDDAIKEANTWSMFGNYNLESRIKTLPSADVVEVVRCKDCKYRYLSGVGKQHYVCDFIDAELKDNGYCSYGVRKDGEEE